MSDERVQTPEKFSRLEEVLLQAATMDEIRISKMSPGIQPVGFYREHDIRFFEYFLSQEGVEVKETERCFVIGNPKHLCTVVDVVDKRLENIVEITHEALPRILVFVGTEEVLLKHYVSRMVTVKPIPMAINRAQTCFINTKYLDYLGVSDPSVTRALIHEPSHTAFNQSIRNISGVPTFQLDEISNIISEALAGPNNLELWDDLQPPEGVVLNFEPLESGEKDLYVWLAEVKAKHGLTDVTYFQNWAVAEFYRWASRQGDLAYWYQKAMELKP